MRTVEAQREQVLAAVRRLPIERVPIAAALGRTLAEPVVSTLDIPVFDNSAMDGFAVRGADVAGAAADVPVVLRVVGEVPAGSGEDPALGPGEAVRIMTGAPTPSSADAVVPVEDTSEGFGAEVGGTVAVLRAPRPGAHIRRAGEDAVRGTELLPAGMRIGSLQRSAIAAAGVAEVTVARIPRVAVISTGSELMPPGEPLSRGQIPESNSFVLAGLVAEADGEVVLRESVTDDPAALAAALERAFELEADLVLMSGGVSEGAYEPVKQALGGTMAFEKVAMQPGKPQGFGVAASGALLLGFPGNPVSVAVSWEVFGRPAILAMQGRTDTERPRLRLPASADWSSSKPRRQYLPAVIDRSDPAHWTAGPATRRGSQSHLAGGLGRAEALIVVPAEVDAVVAGDPVEVWLLG